MFIWLDLIPDKQRPRLPRGCRLAWSRLGDLGSLDPGSNPGSPTNLNTNKAYITVQHLIIKTSARWCKINKPTNLAFLLLTTLLLILCLALFSLPKTIQKSFAIETVNVGVYWNSDCTEEITEINWGNLTPGSTTDINIYVRNEGTVSPCFLSLSSKNWVPTHALIYMTISWNYKNKPINPNEAVAVILTLKIAPQVTGINNFNFIIVITGTESIIGDMNSDGNVNIFDAILLVRSFDSTLGDSHWNPVADLNNDNFVDILDVTMFSANYGASINN